ncbi:relaxin receptor 1-like [Sycon ciliatum]|uniref:relaxin receptor 1-like n=1 Tax=Sycon ciliatum TaxID=27933 RepID=UPI0031F6785E
MAYLATRGSRHSFPSSWKCCLRLAMLICVITPARVQSRCMAIDRTRPSDSKLLSSYVCERKPEFTPSIILDGERDSYELLHISRNDLGDIDPSYWTLFTNLVSLDLTDTNMTVIRQNSYQPLKQKLRFLYVRLNKIRTIEDGAALKDLTELRILRLDNNLISSFFDGIFSKLSKLQYLDFSNNQFRTLRPNVFTGLSNLNILDFSNNQIQVLPSNLFSGLSKLRTLRFGNNMISSFPGGIFSSSLGDNLRVLSFAGNQLRSLDNGVFNSLPNLADLNVDGNKLQTLASEVFNGLADGTNIHLAHNDKVLTNTQLCSIIARNPSLNFILTPEYQSFVQLARQYHCNIPCYKWRPYELDVCNNAFCTGTVASPICHALLSTPSQNCEIAKSASDWRTIIMLTADELSYGNATAYCESRQGRLPTLAENMCVADLGSQVKASRDLDYTPVVWLQDKYFHHPYASNYITYLADRKLHVACALPIMTVPA